MCKQLPGNASPHCAHLVCSLLLAVSTALAGEGLTITSGRWEPVVPLRHRIFSVALGLQIAKVNDGRPEENEDLMACLAEMVSPVLRLPGGDSMNNSCSTPRSATTRWRR